jgi:hypothetical protein
MGLELFVMPLSRYWAGDYITPTMRMAWREFGHPYIVTRPNKPPLVLPEGTPWGGGDAPAKRRAMHALVAETLAAWRRGLGDFTLDEESNAEPRFWRPLPRSWQALIALTGSQSHLRHGRIFLPCDFQEMACTKSYTLASLPVARRELAAIRDCAPRDAADELDGALSAAEELAFPLIVDF